MLYSDIVWENYKNPNNYGKLKGADLVFEDANPKCGDTVKWHLKIEGGKIKDIRFEGSGCALSTAGCSIVSEHFKGMALKKIAAMKDEDVWNILGFKPYVGRILCSTLGFSSLRKAAAEVSNKTTRQNKKVKSKKPLA